MTALEFSIPMRAPSVANLREHWAARAKRIKSQRQAAMLRCPRWVGIPLLVIELIRIGPRELDSDNLASSLKGFRDGIAARLGIDDGSPLVRWVYSQAKGEPEIRVRIYRADP